jgi:SAM-dependent methyltransferase
VPWHLPWHRVLSKIAPRELGIADGGGDLRDVGHAVDPRTLPLGQGQGPWQNSIMTAWVKLQALIDDQYRPIERALTAAVGPVGDRSVVDVGCGTGDTTVAVAASMGPGGRCVGVDVSEAMVEAARGRAARAGVAASFVVADAQEHPFEPHAFDVVMSRFGVMFFDDPPRAFANLRRASRHGGGLRCVVWRSPDENPFWTVAERAAAPILPDLPAREADVPGQFGLSDPARVRGILSAAGWKDIAVDPLDIPCALPESALVEYFTSLGPVALALPSADEGTTARVVEAVRPAFDPFVDGDTVRFTAACHLISATA